ncbi:MAG: urease subunit beta [Cyanobacteria bacterium REEB67]|nr:urease subunit beta [Cyanobacteria bacterium REEB67]
MKPGQIIPGAGEITLNEGKHSHILVVTNTGDRPVQIGSHFHFFEVNRALKFDRPKTLGMRLNIKAGTAVRFEPGQTSEVSLIPYGGSGYISGFNRLVEGSIHDQKVRARALEAVKKFCEMPGNE